MNLFMSFIACLVDRVFEEPFYILAIKLQYKRKKQESNEVIVEYFEKIFAPPPVLQSFYFCVEK